MHQTLCKLLGASALAFGLAFGLTSGAQAIHQPEQPVNINTATAEELVELPRVGPATAARIIEWREENGPFARIEELMNVQGIGERTFERIKPHVTVGDAEEKRPAPASSSSPPKAPRSSGGGVLA